ncbi:MAG: hypothetical protein AB7S65_10900 [Sulfuricurvum sp.]
MRKWFAWLFILSIFVTAVHELGHDPLHEDSCEICLIAHAPALIDISLPVCFVKHEESSFPFAAYPPRFVSALSYPIRAPPFS